MDEIDQLMNNVWESVIKLFIDRKKTNFFYGIKSEKDLSFCFSYLVGRRQYKKGSLKVLERRFEAPFKELNSKNGRRRLDTLFIIDGQKIGVEFKIAIKNGSVGRKNVLSGALSDMERLSKLTENGDLSKGYFFFLTQLSYFVNINLSRNELSKLSKEYHDFNANSVSVKKGIWTLRDKQFKWKKRRDDIWTLKCKF